MLLVFQEVLVFLTKVKGDIEDNYTEDDLKQYVWDQLQSGQVWYHGDKHLLDSTFAGKLTH